MPPKCYVPSMPNLAHSLPYRYDAMRGRTIGAYLALVFQITTAVLKDHKPV